MHRTEPIVIYAYGTILLHQFFFFHFPQYSDTLV
jgi:hypothetical protein